MTIGAGVSSLLMMLLQDLLSAKHIALLFILPFVMGWTLIVYCETVLVLYAGRFLTGLASGILCITIPIYIAEIAHKNIRGSLTTLFQLMIALGITYACILGALLQDPFKLSLACLPIPIVFGCLFAFVPQSPMHYLKNNKFADAVRVMKFLRGPNYDYNDEISQFQILIIEQQYFNGGSNLFGCFFLKSFFTKKVTRRTCFIVLGLMTFQQLSGINVILMYVSQIFEKIETDIPTADLVISFGIIQSLATFVAICTVDRLGRKVLLAISALFMSVSCYAIMLYFTYKSGFHELPTLPIVSLYLYMIMFSIGFGSLLWTITTEIFPPEIKNTGIAITNLVAWLLATATVQYFDWFKSLIELNGIFAIFGLSSSFGLVFVLFFVPETKNKSLNEIQDELLYQTSCD